MISANISNKDRKAVYRRDGYRCALCDCPHGLQLHHILPRSEGGTDAVHNLITLCWKCHAIAHGTSFPELAECVDAQWMEEACVEYISEYYAEEGLIWNPWAKMDKGALD